MIHVLMAINEIVQGGSGIMSAMKKGKLLLKVHEVNSSKKLLILWPMKYCFKACANPFCSYANSCKGVKFQVTIKQYFTTVFKL